jgi:hypothetical protein
LPLQRADQLLDAAEIELALAPVEEVQRLEAMLLDPFDLLGPELGQRVAFQGQAAEGAVALVAAGAAGDLRHLGRRQAAPPMAVELRQPGEGDMVDIHVEAHADRVGGDEIVDLAGLVHRDLGVAGARAERAHHHRGAAAHPPQHLGHRIDLLGREGDDRRARRQPRELGRADIGEGRETRAGGDLRLGQQCARTIGFRLSEPRIIVSSRPRACSIRSVKTWPRSGSAPSCASSSATNATSRSIGMDSAVQRSQRASFGRIFSSPVIRATWLAPFSLTTRS